MICILPTIGEIWGNNSTAVLAGMILLTLYGVYLFIKLFITIWILVKVVREKRRRLDAGPHQLHRESIPEIVEQASHNLPRYNFTAVIIFIIYIYRVFLHLLIH